MVSTTSILKNISIRDKNLSRKLVDALENAKGKPGIDVQYKRKCIEVKGDKIKELFGESK